jgi:hypothetical protein
MRRGLSIAILLAGLLVCCTNAEVIDRIAVSVGSRVITETDLDREIRITALLNHAPLRPPFGKEERRATAERMVDQALVRNELEASRYPPPTAAETESALAEEKVRFGNEAGYRRALAECGVSEDDLKGRLAWQLMLVRFIDARFRPGIQISSGDILKYFNEHMQAGLTIDDYRAGIEKTLTSQAADQQVELWLKEARRRTRIQYRDEVFQ